MLLIKKKNYS